MKKEKHEKVQEEKPMSVNVEEKNEENKIVAQPKMDRASRTK